MRFEVLKAVKISILVFWVVTPYGLAGRYQRFGRTSSTDDGGNMFLRNVGICLQVHMAQKAQMTNIDVVSLSMRENRP
jgi:hypothetical protein